LKWQQQQQQQQGGGLILSSVVLKYFTQDGERERSETYAEVEVKHIRTLLLGG